MLGALCHKGGWLSLVGVSDGLNILIQPVMDGFEGLDVVVLGSEAMFFHGTEHGTGIDRAVREMTVAVHGQMLKVGARPADNATANLNGQFVELFATGQGDDVVSHDDYLTYLWWIAYLSMNTF